MSASTMLSLLYISAVLMLIDAVYLSHQHRYLPPCGSYQDCSTGRTPAYNILPHVPTLSTCHSYSYCDPRCRYYSYYYNPASHLYRHCFLKTLTQCGSEVDDEGTDGLISAPNVDDDEGTDGWINAPKVCKNRMSPLLYVIVGTNNGLLITTTWISSWDKIAESLCWNICPYFMFIILYYVVPDYM